MVYIFLFWLPDYVSSTSGVSAADSGYVANFFEYGGILGGVTSGLLVDLGLGGGLGEAVQYSTVQYSTVQYSTVQYSTVQYSTV